MDNRTDSEQSSRRPTVLFVDDEPYVLDLFETMFDDEYDIRTAQSGQQALTAFGDDIDVAFLDRRMVEMSGDELLAELRERGFETPVVMLSAVNPDVDVDGDCDCDAYLHKPIEKEAVRTTVDQYTT